MKHYLLKTLLVICAITLGVAQGRAEMAVVKSWDFAAIGAKLTGNSVTFASMSSGTVTYDKISCELGTGDVDGLFVQGGAAWHIYKAGSLYNGNGGARLFGINNLKAGDVVTVKTDGAYFPTVTNVTSAFDADTNTYTWTVTADGAVYGKFDPRYHYIYSITVQREKSEKPFEPTGKLVAVNGVSRTVALSTETEGCAIYYTTDETEPTEESTLYTEAGIVISGNTTIKAIAVKDGSASDVYTEAFEAGTTIAVNAPTYLLSAMTSNGSLYNPTYTFSADNSSVLCKPTSTLSATFNGTPVEDFTNAYTFTKGGKLIVTASAAGYDDNTVQVDIKVTAYTLTKQYDLIGGTDINIANWTQQPNETTQNQWKFNEAENYSLNEGCETSGVEGIKFADNATYSWKYYVNYGVRSNQTAKSNVPLTLTNGTDSQIVGWTASTSDYTITNLTTTYKLGSETFNLYRYSRMLTAVSVYDAYEYAPETVYIGSTGYATYCPSMGVNIPAGVEVYVATSAEEGKVVLTEVETGQIPAGAGVVLFTEEPGNSYEFYPNPDAAPITSNKLVGTTTATPLAEGEGYVLAAQGSQAVFSLCAAGTLAPGKAYLPAYEVPVSAAGAPMLAIVFDKATAINAAGSAAAGSQQSAQTYNLAGQKVGAGFKGIVIKTGKKTNNK